MCSGNSNTRSLCRILYLHNIKLNVLCRFEMLAMHLLAFHQDCINLTEVNTDIITTVTLNNTGDNLTLFLKILCIQHLSLLLADLLNNNLLCLLCSDSAEVLWDHLGRYGITQLNLAIFQGCLSQSDLCSRILYQIILYNLIIRKYLDLSGITVDRNTDIVRLTLKLILAGSHQRILNRLENDVLTDLFLLFDRLQCFNKLCAV